MQTKGNRKPGKTPPKSWPEFPPNLGKNPTWNPNGFWEGQFGETTWDNRSHGSGVDRGSGPQDGHWDTSKGRFNRDGSQFLATIGVTAAATYGAYVVVKWTVATVTAPVTGGWSLVVAGATP